MASLGSESYAHRLRPGWRLAHMVRVAFASEFRPVPSIDVSLSRALHLVCIARLATVAFAGAIAVAARQQSPTLAAVFCVVAFHAIGRVRYLPSARGAWLDVAIAAGALGLTGGVLSAYVPYSLVCAVALGFTLGAGSGAIAAACIAAASVPSVGILLRAHGSTPVLALTWFALFPVAAAAGGMLARIWRARESAAQRLLADTNRALTDVYRLARALPSGLELGTVADDVLARVRSDAAVLVVHDGDPAIAGSFGIDDPSVLLHATAGEWVDAGGMRWAAAPLNGGAGTLFARAREGMLKELTAIAGEVSLSVQNALLFRRVRELSVDEERQRIARELHDGVAQALTHLRLELDLTARTAPAEVVDDLERMGRVTTRAATDVRAAIRGLRGGMDGGLAAALEAFVAELSRADGPTIVLDAEPGVRLAAGVEHETFRIVQEAVSNALRHSGARSVVVGLQRRNGVVRVVVDDDGDGFDEHANGRGVGLGAMRERAERMGGMLAVESAPGEGTRVMLEVPLHLERRNLEQRRRPA